MTPFYLAAASPRPDRSHRMYVADTDRDGLRDGIDACPRDPLNNVEGGCTRTSAAYLVLDDSITLGDVATETRGDEFHITATFTNTSDTADRQSVLRGHRPDRRQPARQRRRGARRAGRDTVAGRRRRHPVTGRTDDGDASSLGLATHEAFSFFVSVKGDAGP